ncbi:rhamnulokinase [Actinopolyspora xinjiangensis]|uniref:Rhamnulokinase n=1 Tax=Actinopolyspora xinjiangensis TaxID=405564 RepID=A0A1H0RXE5_9ACTN|nr:rhamnulokinase family protein [Actinopolyspora xinjiangensis]SDP34231.1 rhamnulokinase [Actinopolyspora xinjiangensis]
MTSNDFNCAAVDLGASSGRVVLGRVGDGLLELTELHRFPNNPVADGSGPRWDITAIHRETLAGLRGAAEYEPSSVGIDSWAVDYGLLDGDGTLLAEPRHHRDPRNAAMIERVRERIDDGELYRTTGLQRLPINTLYQLVASLEEGELDSAETLLLIPDLLNYWLTGEIGAEVTNASTTQLFDVRRGEWAHDLARRLELPAHLLPPLRSPGEVVGRPLGEVTARTGLPSSVPVTAVASHDTASAVVAVPATTSRFAYISCGTWSLVGLELDSPVLTERSRAANVTNERGIDGTTRYLRNTMGLWLLQECLRRWRERGFRADLAELLEGAARQPAFRSVLDTDDPAFIAPQDMPTAIGRACSEAGEPVPESPEATVRCVLESLALAHRRTVRNVAELADRDVEIVHLVGGGSRNELLCSLTADACGLPVVAGPAEATALGNVLVQARAHGVVGDRSELRRLVATTQPSRRFEPGGPANQWDAVDRRVPDRARTVGRATVD